MYSKYIMKILENCFQNMNYISRIKLIPVLIHIKYWYYNSPSLKTLFNTILIMFFISFPIFPSTLSHSTRRHQKYCRYQPICQAEPIKFIINLCADHNTLWVKHTTHQKAESLRAAPFKVRKHGQHNSIFNTKYAEFCTKW